MSARRGITIAVVLLILALQWGVPSMQLFADGANRWGWQMYSRAPAQPSVTAVSADGEQQTVQLEDHVYRLRYEMRYDEQFAAALCENLLDAVELEVRDDVTGETVSVTCNR